MYGFGPYGYYYGFDWTYILVLIGAILSMIASAKVNSTFNRYQRVRSMSGMTGAEAAQRILHQNGIYDVSVEHVSGNLTDHYDPRTNVIRLSDNVYNSTSVAAIGVACHEAGHAAQYATNYSPIKIRNTILPLANIGSKAGIPLAILGYFLGFGPLAIAGVVFFSFAVLFQLVTLPVEFNASKRALNVISEVDILSDDEKKGAKSVLTSAAMTYVAALAVSVANLLRLILSMNRRRD